MSVSLRRTLTRKINDNVKWSGVLRAQNMENLGAASVCLLEHLRPLLLRELCHVLHVMQKVSPLLGPHNCKGFADFPDLRGLLTITFWSKLKDITCWHSTNT
jgi:hypothetical protein